MTEYDGITFSATRSSTTGLLWITASGTNPTSGWEQELTQISDTEFEFTRTEPDGTVLQVLTPFFINVVAIYTGQSILDIKISGKTVHIDVLDPTIQDDMYINGFLSASNLYTASPSSVFGIKEGDLRRLSSNNCFQTKLGSVSIPFGCATWQRPTRAKKYTFYVRICAPSEEEARRAVEQCLKEGAIAAALAAVLIPGGWSVAWGTFKVAFTSCISNKLDDFSIALWYEDRCY
jgi:hypothetical protein